MFKIHDKMYDITDFKSIHPGGDDVFKNLQENTDITPTIYSYHTGIPRILKTLAPYERKNVNNNQPVRFVSNFDYKNYCDLKALVYRELHLNRIPQNWSSGEVIYNCFMVSLIMLLWSYSIYYSLVSTISIMPILLISFMTVGHGFLSFHEVCHYSAFKEPFLNNYFPLHHMLPFISQDEWKYEHNYLHHSFTNTPNDCDIEALDPILRHTNKHAFYGFHRFQFIYVNFILCLTSLSKGPLRCILNKQYHRLIYNIALLYIFEFKYFCVMHGIIGFMFAFIAQLSHIQHECIQVNTENKNDFLYNQVSSSINYRTDDVVSRFFTFGLDIQIEHHLFPNLPHSSLRKIHHVVKKYCIENNIPYIEKPSIFSAAYSYVSYLYYMGHRDSLIASELAQGKDKNK